MHISRRQIAKTIPKLANQLIVLVTKTQWRGEVGTTTISCPKWTLYRCHKQWTTYGCHGSASVMEFLQGIGNEIQTA
ncbi:hypothetical protein [Scytonema sp. NUACC21]